MQVEAGDYIDRIKLPAGFKISIYASGLPGVRSMAMSHEGTLFVDARSNFKRQRVGKVYAVTDRNKDLKRDEVITIAKELNIPNGAAFKDENLYVVKINRIIRYENIDRKLINSSKPIVVNND